MDAITTAVTDTVLKKGEGLLKTLFGPAFQEVGESFADRVRLRRFNNQLEIFSKASDKLREKGLSAKPIALKHLVPLLDLSSLEEEPSIQNKWANVIANLAAFDSLEVFNKNCIELLNRLSPAELLLLDTLYDKFTKERGEVVEQRDGKIELKDYRDLVPGDVLFDPWEIGDELGLDSVRTKLFIENLVALGLLQFEEMDFADDELIKSFNVHLSYLGLYFVRLAKF